MLLSTGVFWAQGVQRAVQRHFLSGSEIPVARALGIIAVYGIICIFFFQLAY